MELENSLSPLLDTTVIEKWLFILLVVKCPGGWKNCIGAEGQNQGLMHTLQAL